MVLRSSEFKHNNKIPERYSCDGKDISPSLIIEGVPDNAESLALIMDDPDAPGGTFTHWLLWNIAPENQEIPENSKPEGALVGRNDFNKKAYGGPCPPSDTHHYFFKLYALSSGLNLQTGATKNQLEGRIKDIIIDQTELVGTYSKK